MSSAFRTLRIVRGAKLPAVPITRRPAAIQQMAKFSSKPTAAATKAIGNVKPSMILSKLRMAPIAKPHPFITARLQAGMPQLVPFYFVNQVVYGFALLTTLIYLLSKYILPRMVRLFLSRTFITKL